MSHHLAILRLLTNSLLEINSIKNGSKCQQISFTLQVKTVPLTSTPTHCYEYTRADWLAGMNREIKALAWSDTWKTSTSHEITKNRTSVCRTQGRLQSLLPILSQVNIQPQNPSVVPDTERNLPLESRSDLQRKKSPSKSPQYMCTICFQH